MTDKKPAVVGQFVTLTEGGWIAYHPTERRQLREGDKVQVIHVDEDDGEISYDSYRGRNVIPLDYYAIVECTCDPFAILVGGCSCEASRP